MIELKAVVIDKPPEVNVIIGQSHFIKTVEDLHEVLVQTVSGIKFGLAFCEASGPCLVRHSGTDHELEQLAVGAARAIGAGHVFVVMLGNAFPLSVLNQVKLVAEVCTVYCAGSNPLRVVVACEGEDRGLVGVIDGSAPKGVEDQEQKRERQALLRRLGYKL
jgi:adenosine/AMP kinase